MSDLISKAALFNSIANCREKAEIFAAIQNAPTVDAEPIRHGYWIEEDGYQICSECGEEHGWDEYRASWCENCGAKMDEGKEK